MSADIILFLDAFCAYASFGCDTVSMYAYPIYLLPTPHGTCKSFCPRAHRLSCLPRIYPVQFAGKPLSIG
eukprot:scaffold239743_cov15-Prasinocladus_malaysianus.AAC.1